MLSQCWRCSGIRVVAGGVVAGGIVAGGIVAGFHCRYIVTSNVRKEMSVLTFV